ncbi:NAD(P)/FAD-dependent oxidoreductase [Candidatus Micrarchaeota archaeon]|nr:NAD(P)/FAD-dependent oxidoreductase [Candidatus Micrarchaeota archaeon]
MYDVAVIGGGPAGLSFAKTAQNIKTIVLEEHERFGAPVHCGECISDLCLRKFDLKPPKDAIARLVKGVKIIFPDDHTSILSERGYVLNKDIFEQYLADEVQKKGIEIKTACRVEGIERKEGHWLLKTNKGNVEAKIIVDATGHIQLVSNLLKLNKSSMKNVGIQYRMNDVDFGEYLDFYLWPDLAPKGYLWMIPKSNGERGYANVGLVTDDIKNAKENLDKFIKLKKWNDVEFTFGGMIPSSGPLEKTYHTGIMMIGDAAGFASPLFEGGTHLALMSGKLAAEVAIEAVEKKDFSQAFLERYESAWKKEFPPYETLVKGKKAIYEKLSIKDLCLLGELLPENFDNFGNKEKLLLGMKMMMRDPKLYKKDVLDALFAFAYSESKYYGW